MKNRLACCGRKIVLLQQNKNYPMQQNYKQQQRDQKCLNKSFCEKPNSGVL